MGVAFNYDTFIAQYPEFTAVPDSLIAAWWASAVGWYDNNGWPGQLTIAPTAMGLLTAHLMWLFLGRDQNGLPVAPGTPGATAPSSLVGRINSAAEGSVSVGSEYDTGGGAGPNEAWFTQTRYGAAFWALIAPYRTAVYIPKDTPPVAVPSAFYPMIPPWPVV